MTSTWTSGPARPCALRAGYERVSAWAEVLDRINVFPIADGDTGRNLVMSLAPLLDASPPAGAVVERLLMSARGNSGNIAVEFVRKLVEPPEDLGPAARFAAGAIAARKAVRDPQPGTMLTTLDALASAAAQGLEPNDVERVLSDVTAAVEATAHGLPALRAAGVVDSGSLGIFLFVEGLLCSAFGLDASPSLAARFRALSRFSRDGAGPRTGCCIDVVLRPAAGSTPDPETLGAIGSDAITLREGGLYKVHLHADSEGAARAALGRLGEVVGYSWDDLGEQVSLVPLVAPEGAVHVVTDGAASLSRRDAEALGVTLLDSYVNLGDRSLPETRIAPEDVYAAMRTGLRVTTSQASTFERRQHYERLAAQYEQLLYLCVGSAFTGIAPFASAWAAEHAPDAHVIVLDSGAASGRLAIVVRAVARKAQAGAGLPDLAGFARAALERAEEYIFLDKLEYLARGGRVGKAGAFFADMLGVAPVVTPMPDGVHKLALVRKLEDKIAYACGRLSRALAPSAGRGGVLLQYTDNRDWLQRALVPRVRDLFPHAECVTGPMSLTSGAHMGPGTWSIAVLADDARLAQG